MEGRFVYGSNITVVYRKWRLALIELTSARTHVIEGPLASIFQRLCEPTYFPDLYKEEESLLKQVTTEFIRLVRSGFVVEELHNEYSFSHSAPFWEDAFVYHALSRTMNSSKFCSLDEQNAAYSEALCRRAAGFTNREHRNDEVLALPSMKVPLPDRSFFDVLYNRRTKRVFSEEAMPLSEFSWIVEATWAYKLSYYKTAYGIANNMRTSPSSGGLQSIKVYPVILNVADVKRGAYFYDPDQHALVTITHDLTDEWLVEAFAGQSWISNASAVFIMSASVDFAMIRYNASRTYRMLLIEAGHFSQTLMLCAELMGKSAFAFGAMKEEMVEDKLKISPVREPILFAAGIGQALPDSKFDEWVSGQRVKGGKDDRG